MQSGLLVDWAKHDAAALLREMQEAGISSLSVHFRGRNGKSRFHLLEPDSGGPPADAMVSLLREGGPSRRDGLRREMTMEEAARQVALEWLDAMDPLWAADLGAAGKIVFAPPGVQVEFGRAVEIVEWSFAEFNATEATLAGDGVFFEGGDLAVPEPESPAHGTDDWYARKGRYAELRIPEGVPPSMRRMTATENLENLQGTMQEMGLHGIGFRFVGGHGGCDVEVTGFDPPQQPNMDVRMRYLYGFRHHDDGGWGNIALDPPPRFEEAIGKIAVQLLDVAYPSWTVGAGSAGEISIEGECVDIEIDLNGPDGVRRSFCSFDEEGRCSYRRLPEVEGDVGRGPAVAPGM